MPTPSDPKSAPSKQFSSDVNGDPEALCNSTRAGISKHAELNEAYGLTQPVATPGSHPWLRDELATPGIEEPGNAVPSRDLEIPKRSGV